MSDCDIVYHTACTYEGLSVFSPSLVVENTTQIAVNTMTAAIQAASKICSLLVNGQIRYTRGNSFYRGHDL